MSSDHPPHSPAVESPVSREAPPLAPARRRRILLRLLAILLLAGGAWTGWELLFGRYHVTTENAYVGGDQVPVTAQVVGLVQSVDAESTMRVAKGQTLVRLGTADAQLRLQSAEAALTQAVLDARSALAALGALDAQVSARAAEQHRAEVELARATAEYERRQRLRQSGATTQEELTNAALAVDAVRAALDAAQQRQRVAVAQSSAQRVKLANITVQTHPAVLHAEAEVRSAWLALARATLLAPVDGTVARRSVQVGQRVKPGDTLMTLVPLDDVWVDANFKEDQLALVRLGQPAELHSDFYGPDVVFHGVVAGIAAGTGAAFALLPAQNATGNWIKVVQRLPVRILLRKEELETHPLRLGLSMHVSVDVHDTSGSPLAPLDARFHLDTDVYARQREDAEAYTRAIMIRLGAG